MSESGCTKKGCAICLEISRITNARDKELAHWSHNRFEEIRRNADEESEKLNEYSRQRHEKPFPLKRAVEGVSVNPRPKLSLLCQVMDCVVLIASIAFLLGMYTVHLLQ